MLAEWVNPFYLDVGVGSQIREQFEEESQVKLDDFFLVSACVLNCVSEVLQLVLLWCSRRTSIRLCARPWR